MSARDPARRRLRLALPYTILADPDTVHLVAGEDFRYTLEGPGIDVWLPELLRRCDGVAPLAEVLGGVPAPQRAAAQGLLDRLLGERVLSEGAAAQAHRPTRPRIEVDGQAEWLGLAAADGADGADGAADGAPVSVLCQDRLDYAAALSWNRRCLAGAAPYLWVTCGPLSRGYVSPLFWPDAGPCLQCVVLHFQRLSPAPQIFARLHDHAARGGVIAPVPFPKEGAAMLRQIVRWKLGQLAESAPSAALYRLHVLEAATLEVSTHAVPRDPQCPACGAA